MESRRKIAGPFCDMSFDFDENTVSGLMDFTGGRGADVILPCCPGNEAFQMGLEIGARRGRLGFFSGLTANSGIENAALNTIHYRELSLVGAYGCSSGDFSRALELLGSGVIDISAVPSLDISWDELPETLSSLEPQEHIFTFFCP
jgi:L-iditol 2-dehydrogenase